jgi:hypothetical protein
MDADHQEPQLLGGPDVIDKKEAERMPLYMSTFGYKPEI